MPDSRPDTYEHILEVQKSINLAVVNLLRRSELHDLTKLEHPEVGYLDEHNHKLETLRVNSPEYKESLLALKPALDHHYAKNRHHPEHYPDRMRGMSLLDLLEMMCDCYASSQRQHSGNLRMSIQSMQERFGFTDELKQIFMNTIEELFGHDV